MDQAAGRGRLRHRLRRGAGKLRNTAGKELLHSSRRRAAHPLALVQRTPLCRVHLRLALCYGLGHVLMSALWGRRSIFSSRRTRRGTPGGLGSWAAANRPRGRGGSCPVGAGRSRRRSWRTPTARGAPPGRPWWGSCGALWTAPSTATGTEAAPPRATAPGVSPVREPLTLRTSLRCVDETASVSERSPCGWSLSLIKLTQAPLSVQSQRALAVRDPSPRLCRAPRGQTG